jgi:long-subunit fatty acid transport protein
MRLRVFVFASAALACVLLSGPAQAQTPSQETWSVEGDVGWDFPVSGNILSAAIGSVFGQTAIIDSQSYGDIYGTGVKWGFGVGYRLDDRSEVRGSMTFQSVSADLKQIGTTANAPLYATFDPYKSFSLDAGYRRYFASSSERLRPYAGGTVGVAIVSEIDADLAAPDLNQRLNATDFYDRTGAFTIGFNGGALYAITDRLDVKGELGFRHISGLSAIDGLQGTGLESTNDNTGRWTLPFTVGLRVRF